MELKDNNQFKRVSPPDKIKIFNELISYPEEILCKTDSDFFQITAVQLMNSNKLFFNFVGKEKEIRSGTEVICQFIFQKKELYIFKTSFLKDRFSIYLDISTDLFQIQRRDNFRLVFPENFNSKVYLKDKIGNLKIGKIYDLSTTGVRVCFPQAIENAAVNDSYTLDIKVIGHNDIQNKAILRHFNQETENNAGKIIVKYFYGFQFDRLTAEDEKILSSINMELYRNFFSKVGSL